MKIFGFNISRKEQRASYNGLENLWGDGGVTTAGVNVTADSAMKSSAVFACVRVLAETLASIPLHVYKRLESGGKERASDHNLYSILHDQPNEHQTAFEFVEMMMGHLALRFNAYAKINYTNGGKVESLMPLHPDRVELKELGDGRYFFVYRPQYGKAMNLRSDEVLHLKGLSADGWSGLDPIATLKDTVGLALAADEHGARFFSQSATPSGILKYPSKLNAQELKNLRASWNDIHSGTKNANKVSILENGLEWVSVGMNNEQAQFLQTRQFQVAEIARMFRVPPHLIGDLSKSSFSNIEQQSLEFVNYSIRPWAVRWEQAIKKALISESEKKTYFAEFLLDGLMRGDSAARAQYFSTARTSGWLNVDEIREIENMNPLPDGIGKIYLQPLNMQEAGKEPPEPKPLDKNLPQAKVDPDPEAKAMPDLSSLRASAVELFSDIIGRMLRKEEKAMQGAAKKQNFEQIRSEFATEHRELITESLRSATKLYLQQIKMIARYQQVPVVDDVSAPIVVESSLARSCEQYFIEPRQTEKEISMRIIGNLESLATSPTITDSQIELKQITTPNIKLLSQPQEVTVVLERQEPKVTVRDIEIKRDATGRMNGARVTEVLE